MATWNARSLETPLRDEYIIAQQLGLTSLGTYNPASRLPSGGPSDHARYPARAFDVGGQPGKLEQFFRLMVNRPGIEYVIYKDKIWSRSRGLHRYTSGGHETHVHVSGTGTAAPATKLTPKQLSDVGKGILEGRIKPDDLPPGSTVRTGGPFADEARAVAGAITSPLEALRWVSQNWDRVLEVVGGFILVLVGLVLVGRALGVAGGPVKTVVGDVANRMQYGPTVVQAKPEPRVVKVHEVTDAGERAAARRAARVNPAESEIPF